MTMPIPNTRGSWTLDGAINQRWDDAGLDTTIKLEWPAADRLIDKYQALNDGFARPKPPGPYVVYEKSIPVVMAHMSGHTAAQREDQLQQILVAFRIHAKSTAAESAKSICIRLAKEVAEAFDPNTAPWEMADDKIVIVKRGPDFHAREDDDEWVWVLQYDVLIDAEYLQA